MKRFKNILVVCDERSVTDSVFARVRWLAQANGASVTLIDVIDAEPGTLARLFSALPGTQAHEIEDQVLDVHRARLDKLAETLRADGIPVKKTVQQGVTFLQVIRRVLREDHDLVIKGAEESTGGLFASNDMHLMRKCPCPVWILKGGDAAEATRILAAVDPDPEDPVRNRTNHTVMELATSLARHDAASLEVMNAWRVQEEGTLRHGLVKMSENDVTAIIENERRQSADRLNALMADFPEFAGTIKVHHVKGIAGDAIPAHVAREGIDTVVMGTIGRTGVAGLFIGNTAETILNRVGCSVLTVKPPGFVSPVEAEAGT